jgi:hypothetical protein
MTDAKYQVTGTKFQDSRPLLTPESCLLILILETWHLILFQCPAWCKKSVVLESSPKIS